MSTRDKRTVPVPRWVVEALRHWGTGQWPRQVETAGIWFRTHGRALLDAAEAGGGDPLLAALPAEAVEEYRRGETRSLAEVRADALEQRMEAVEGVLGTAQCPHCNRVVRLTKNKHMAGMFWCEGCHLFLGRQLVVTAATRSDAPPAEASEASAASKGGQPQSSTAEEWAPSVAARDRMEVLLADGPARTTAELAQEGREMAAGPKLAAELARIKGLLRDVFANISHMEWRDNPDGGDAREVLCFWFRSGADAEASAYRALRDLQRIRDGQPEPAAPNIPLTERGSVLGGQAVYERALQRRSRAAGGGEGDIPLGERGSVLRSDGSVVLSAEDAEAQLDISAAHVAEAEGKSAGRVSLQMRYMLAVHQQRSRAAEGGEGE